MSGFSDIIEAIMDYGTLDETGIIPPFLVTPTTTETPIFESQSPLDTRVFWVGIEIRAMGSAAYVEIGTFMNLNSRLIAQNSYIEFDAPKNKYLDARTLACQSDAADAILEITGVYA